MADGGTETVATTVDQAFVDPPWDAPLDAAAALSGIPSEASVAGMFPDKVVKGVRRRGKRLSSARDRYLPFQFYPQREHAELLVEACAALLPRLPLRSALRELGHAAPEALMASQVGRVTLGSVEGVTAVLEAMVKTYPINLRPSRARILESAPGRIVLRLENVYYFLDSHHVGVLEGAMQHAGVSGQVRIRVQGPHAADMLCTW